MTRYIMGGNESSCFDNEDQVCCINVGKTEDKIKSYDCTVHITDDISLPL